MTPEQAKLLDEIEALKAVLRAGGPFTFADGETPCSRKQFERRILDKARVLCRPDDRTTSMKMIGTGTQGAGSGRSRSPSLGSWDATDWKGSDYRSPQ